jgi:molybdopterin-binding protein
MKVGARNRIVGKISDVKKGALMCQVKVRVDGPVDLSSVMTIDSLEELGVKKGDSVTVIVKAVSVLLVRE